MSKLDLLNGAKIVARWREPVVPHMASGSWKLDFGEARAHIGGPLIFTTDQARVKAVRIVGLLDGLDQLLRSDDLNVKRALRLPMLASIPTGDVFSIGAVYAENVSQRSGYRATVIDLIPAAHSQPVTKASEIIRIMRCVRDDSRFRIKCKMKNRVRVAGVGLIGEQIALVGAILVPR